MSGRLFILIISLGEETGDFTTILQIREDLEGVYEGREEWPGPIPGASQNKGRLPLRQRGLCTGSLATALRHKDVAEGHRSLPIMPSLTSLYQW